jgi:monoterpene epsilon-lactone hydrolase
MSAEQMEALRALLASRPQVGADLAARREGFERLAARFPLAPDVRLEPVEAGGVPGAWIRSDGTDDADALLYLHGGAFVVGSSRTHAELASRLGRAAGAAALCLDYRLAPEHRWPAALDDALTAYRWLLDRGTPPRRIVVAGDSAGANLTLALLVAARDRGWPMPAAAGSISGYFDLTNGRASIRERAHMDPFIDPTRMDYSAGLYASPDQLRLPTVSPLFADLRGLPPLLLHVGECEVLHDDTVDLAAAARAAGVEAEAVVWPGMVHVWHFFAQMLDEGREATERMGAFLRARLDA